MNKVIIKALIEAGVIRFFPELSMIIEVGDVPGVSVEEKREFLEELDEMGVTFTNEAVSKAIRKAKELEDK